VFGTRCNSKNVGPEPCFLIGPMGVGKSTIGRTLARELKMDFIDSDYELEQRTGATVSLIFDIEGEEGFRRREAQIVQELAERSNVVMATGGGSIIDEENRKALRKNGTVVYLSATVDTQIARVRNTRNRPMLQDGDPREILEGLNIERDPVYREEADFIFATDDRSPANVAREIARELLQS